MVAEDRDAEFIPPQPAEDRGDPFVVPRGVHEVAGKYHQIRGRAGGQVVHHLIEPRPARGAVEVNVADELDRQPVPRGRQTWDGQRRLGEIDAEGQVVFAAHSESPASMKVFRFSRARCRRDFTADTLERVSRARSS